MEGSHTEEQWEDWKAGACVRVPMASAELGSFWYFISLCPHTVCCVRYLLLGASGCG